MKLSKLEKAVIDAQAAFAPILADLMRAECADASLATTQLAEALRAYCNMLAALPWKVRQAYPMPLSLFDPPPGWTLPSGAVPPRHLISEGQRAAGLRNAKRASPEAMAAQG